MGYDEPKSLGEGESGGGLALPMWIDSMARALRGVPVQALAPPEGVVAVAGDWRYAEFAEGGFVARVGAAASAELKPSPGSAAAASAPASAVTR
jgi:penicillin-binding protein 1A